LPGATTGFPEPPQEVHAKQNANKAVAMIG
jgi:hypothetical protein